MLSHGAIIAREFGIPCVVGVRDAMGAIPDGASDHCRWRRRKGPCRRLSSSSRICESESALACSFRWRSCSHSPAGCSLQPGFRRVGILCRSDTSIRAVTGVPRVGRSRGSQCGSCAASESCHGTVDAHRAVPRARRVACGRRVDVAAPLSDPPPRFIAIATAVAALSVWYSTRRSENGIASPASTSCS